MTIWRIVETSNLILHLRNKYSQRCYGDKFGYIYPKNTYNIHHEEHIELLKLHTLYEEVWHTV